MTSTSKAQIAEVLLSLVPADGAPIGNGALREELSQELRREIDEYEYIAIRDALIAQGMLVKGKGRGGSVKLAQRDPSSFDLAKQEVRDAESGAPQPSCWRRGARA